MESSTPPEPTTLSPAVPPPDQPAAPAPPQGQPSAPPASGDDLAAQVDALRLQLAELASKAASGQLAIAPTDTELAAKVDELRAQFSTWPGAAHADSPQPWDLQAHGLPQPGVTRDHLPGGAPDEISPVVVAHSKPLLTTGMAGDAVAELAGLLQKAGYETSISRGTNHGYVFDESLTAAVNAFKRDYHVAEDPSQFNNDEQQTARFVGPYIWEALIRVADRLPTAGGQVTA